MERKTSHLSLFVPTSLREALFGHQDRGELVRKLYGHPDATLARERVRVAFRQAPPVPVPLAAVGT